MMKPILTASGLCKSFRLPGCKPLEVIRGVDFTLTAGEKVAIVGRSGAGKSTLLNLLGGLLKPSAGTITRPDNIAFVFQSCHLLPELTVLENVVLPTLSYRRHLPASVAHCRARELLDKVGLSARLEHLPSELSGGERQRVALARALVTNPALVLADEPTGNLDALTGADILAILAKLSVGSDTALVLVTHSAAAAAICDRTLTLADGRLI